MKNKLFLFSVIALICSLILLLNFTAKADSIENEDPVTCSDIVESNGGIVEFKKIYEQYDTYNVNSHSDFIDTVGTIDEVMVLSTESSNTIFTFKTYLNRNELTKYFNILEWFIVPTRLQPYGSPNYGVEAADSDFESFEITIKDVNNPNKYVVFRTTNRPDSDTYNTSVSGRVGANGQSIEGIHQSEPDTINKMWGTNLKASHVGSFVDYDAVPAGFSQSLPLGGFLSLDYETKQVFSVTGAEKGKRVLVKDLDDGRFMVGTDVPWDGFDSKELEVSIRFLNIVSGRTASVAILGYNGMNFTKGKVVDNKAPKVIESTVIDEPVLYGEVDKAIPITKCYAYDLLDGFIDDIEYKVYYNYNLSNQKEIEIVDGRFLPDRNGTYSIVASAVDRFGNVGTFIREVEIRKGINDLHLDLLSEFPFTCNVGEQVHLPNAYVYGGSVNKKYEVEVLFGNQLIEIDSNNCFTPLKQGLYVVRYKAIDFYENPAYFDYSIRASISEEPIVYFPEIDKVVETKTRINIPEFRAIDYSSFGDGVDAKISYFIKEPSSSEYKEISKDYAPSVEGNYTLKIVASSVLNKDKNTFKEYEIYAKDCKLIRDFFITDGMNIDNERGDMVFVTPNTNGSFYFLNPVLKNSLELEFSARNLSEDAPEIVITLTDSLNRNNTVTLHIEKSKTESSTISYLNQSQTIKGAVGLGLFSFDLSYRSGWIYDGNNAVIKLNAYDNGEAFDDFSSGKVYVSMAVNNSIGDTTLSFYKFCGNQDFSYNADDITEPTVIYSDLGRVYKIGDEVSFSYDSFDLFDRYCTVNTRIEHSGKKISAGVDGKCSFTITEFGKYTVIFKAYDKFGNEASSSFNIYCYDNISPTISVNSNIQRSVQLGNTISLPQAEVNDNIDTDLSFAVYAKNPTGAFVIIENFEFTPNVKGKWTIYYYTVDSCGNYALASFDVLVY